MDISEVTKEIRQLFFSWGLDLTSSSEEEGKGYVFCPVCIDPYEHHIDILVALEEDGTCRIDFSMGLIENEDPVYPLLNDFNIKVPLYKAMCYEGGLHIVSVFEDNDVENIVQRISNAMNDIADEEYVYEPLKPILEYIADEEEPNALEA